MSRPPGGPDGTDPEPAPEPHPTTELDDVVHQRTRLGVLAVLREVERAEFGYVRQALGLTDGNLSRHLKVLADAGLVDVHKGYADNRPRTWISLTKLGAKALDAELKALHELVRRLSR
jgi:DNA-binding MarR family transcriptional regulator